MTWYHYQMHVRQDWIKNTEFHPIASPKVLEQVIERCKRLVAQGRVGVVVFDLDSTLFDVSHRSFRILAEWMTHADSKDAHETKAALGEIKPEEFQYSLQDLWELKKIPHDREPFLSHFKNAKEFWRKRFFNHDYLEHDEPAEGAVEFVKLLYELGVQIVYLTGRDIPLMGFGTFDQLKKHGLPIELPRTRLILKPKRYIDDLDFKSGAAREIMELGEVVAAFENEPKNLIAMQKVFKPETMNIFIQTVSSDHPAPAGNQIFKINHFKISD